MPLLPLELLREPGPWLMEFLSHSVNRILLTAQVHTTFSLSRPCANPISVLLQWCMATMAVREGTCTIPTSTSLPMVESILQRLMPTRNRYPPRNKIMVQLLLWCLYMQQSYCKFTTGGLGAEITGFIQIDSGNENNLQTAVAYVGPVATAVDASSSAFRVSHCLLQAGRPNCVYFLVHIHKHSTTLEVCTAQFDAPEQV